MINPTELVKAVERLRRTMPRHPDVNLVGDGVMELLHDVTKSSSVTDVTKPNSVTVTKRKIVTGGGRRPIGERAMTAAERKRRQRAKKCEK